MIVKFGALQKLSHAPFPDLSIQFLKCNLKYDNGMYLFSHRTLWIVVIFVLLKDELSIWASSAEYDNYNYYYVVVLITM